jgi:hypothetical protein
MHFYNPYYWYWRWWGWPWYYPYYYPYWWWTWRYYPIILFRDRELLGQPIVKGSEETTSEGTAIEGPDGSMQMESDLSQFSADETTVRYMEMAWENTGGEDMQLEANTLEFETGFESVDFERRLNGGRRLAPACKDGTVDGTPEVFGDPHIETW